MIHQFPHAKRLSRVWARRFSTGCRSAAVPRCRLPACASGHERPDDESERSWEGLKQVEEGLPQCR